jgi:hypothetical protein
MPRVRTCTSGLRLLLIFFLRGFLLFFFRAFQRGFEVADAFGQAFADVAQPTGAEEQEGEDDYQKPVPWRELTHNFSTGTAFASPA